MAGLTPQTPLPTAITLHTRSRVLEIGFDTGETFSLGAEFLRVLSPSAEVRGHGAGPGVLQQGKQDVQLLRIDPVGNYALKLTFSDGHDSGLYSWDYLYDLGRRQQELWEAYLARLAAEGGSRDPAALPPPPPQHGKGCGHGH